MIRPTFLLSDKPYKRSDHFVKSPFRYPGGKFYALPHILPFITCVPHDEYREPFVGGGSVFFAKPKTTSNWINDLETDIIQTYRIMADSTLRHTLATRIGHEIASKERHAEIKNMETNSPLDLAYKTFYLNRTSYSGIIHKPAWGYKEAKSAPPSSWRNFVLEAGAKLEGVTITSLDFTQVIATPSISGRVLMYLDPPYFHADQKRAYIKSFKIEDHQRLAATLKSTSHLFCLSYDDCDEIRQMYDWAEIYEVSWLYNTANVNGESRKVGRELIITNYRVEKSNIIQPLLLL